MFHLSRQGGYMAESSFKNDVIPFFRFYGTDISLLPSDSTPTERVWLEKEKLMMAILDSISDGVFTIDFNMKITSFNRAAERITGYTAQEAIGKNCMDVFCNIGGMKTDCLSECPMRKTMKFKTPITKKRTICNKKGEILSVSATTILLLDLNDQPIGGVESFVDVTDFEKLKEKWQGKKYNLDNIIGKSPRMAEIYQLIESISESVANVMIQGETGTGKGLIANAIHYRSVNHKGPFVHVNCASLPQNLLESELFGHVKGAYTGAISDREGRFEQAHRGTLFLDEIGEMSFEMQAKLLRVVEDKKFERVGGNKTITTEVRLISATNKNIEEELDTGKFRRDLFYRLNIIPIRLPSLRERMEDIPLLVTHFTEKLNYKLQKNIRGVAPEVLDLFMRYRWPGNVRELENVLEYSFIKCHDDHLEVRCLPPVFLSHQRQATDLSLSLPEFPEVFHEPPDYIGSPAPTKSEKEKLIQTLQACKWNRQEAAKALNTSRTTLWRLIRKYDLA
jgi:PAS domain S-box-containing protein